MQATQHQPPHGSSRSSGLTSKWPRQQLLQHRKVIEWLALLSDLVEPTPTEGSLLDGRPSPIPPAEGDLLHLPASLAANRQRKLECGGSPSGTPSPGVPSPRGVVTMQGGGGAGSSGDGEETDNGRRKASGRRDCAAEVET
ncbi:hypothetical protein CLOM_g24621 [Closterium sp. NIES-68]|nr:hypothetical protein CLOM_g24621 [Closterium sp. NIES-68]